MEKVNKRRRQPLQDVPELKRSRRLDVPELIQQIQSLLPPDQAARTCVVSKSWLHALSATPDLRFQPVKSLNKQQNTHYMNFINRTLQRYHRDNLPIISCHLHFGIHNQRSASSVQKWIKLLLTSKTCLKELCLTILPAIASYTLPDEVFSSQKLDKLILKLDESKTYSLHISSNPVFNCVNLRALELLDVHITEDVLHNLLSTCKLLEKINLKLPEVLEKIQVDNLRYLHELKIETSGLRRYLEISSVPCLRSLSYNETLIIWKPVSSNTDSIGSLRELCLEYVSMDAECSDMINSKFPFLESLTLTLTCCHHMETLDIRCASLKRLTIHLMQYDQIKVQVWSPKLLFFSYKCNTLPDFLFPSIAPEQFVLHMMMFNAIDDVFFLKLRDVLNLSSKFTIHLNCFGSMVPFDIDIFRRRIMFPATNVEYMLFQTYDKVLWEKSLIIDVLFSVCHPDCIMVYRPLTHKLANYLLNPNIKEKVVMKTGNVYRPHLKDGDAKWEALTSSSKSPLGKWCEFKPNWCSG